MSEWYKSHGELLALGLHKTLVLMYGVIEFRAGSKGEQLTHQELAEICHLSKKNPRQVIRLLEELRRFKLIEWTRGRYANQYRSLNPDRKFISALLANPDLSRMSDLRSVRSDIHDTLDLSPMSDLTPLLRDKEVKKKKEYPPTPQATGDARADVARRKIDARAPIPVTAVVAVPRNADAPDLFQEFMGVFMAAGKVVNDIDIERALKLWLNFDAPEHAVILQHLKRAVEDGTWSSARYTPMPASYLGSKAWTRIGPGRVLPRPPQSESKAERGQREAKSRFLGGKR